MKFLVVLTLLLVSTFDFSQGQSTCEPNLQRSSLAMSNFSPALFSGPWYTLRTSQAASEITEGCNFNLFSWNIITNSFSWSQKGVNLSTNQTFLRTSNATPASSNSRALFNVNSVAGQDNVSGQLMVYDTDYVNFAIVGNSLCVDAEVDDDNDGEEDGVEVGLILTRSGVLFQGSEARINSYMSRNLNGLVFTNTVQEPNPICLSLGI